MWMILQRSLSKEIIHKIRCHNMVRWGFSDSVMKTVNLLGDVRDPNATLSLKYVPNRQTGSHYRPLSSFFIISSRKIAPLYPAAFPFQSHHWGRHYRCHLWATCWGFVWLAGQTQLNSGVAQHQRNDGSLPCCPTAQLIINWGKRNCGSKATKKMYDTSITMHGATRLTLQLHQILCLPRMCIPLTPFGSAHDIVLQECLEIFWVKEN